MGQQTLQKALVRSWKAQVQCWGNGTFREGGIQGGQKRISIFRLNLHGWKINDIGPSPW